MWKGDNFNKVSNDIPPLKSWKKKKRKSPHFSDEALTSKLNSSHSHICSEWLFSWRKERGQEKLPLLSVSYVQEVANKSSSSPFEATNFFEKGCLE